MAAWRISPSEGVINYNNGDFDLPPNNTEEDIEYMVRYEADDEGECVSNDVIITVKACQPCECGSITITENPVNFGVEGGKKTIGTVRRGCESVFNIQGNIPWFTVSLENDNNLTVLAERNITEPNGRQGGVVLMINDTPCVNPLLVKEEGGDATFNIYIYETLNTYRPTGANHDVWEIGLNYMRDDVGLPSAHDYPLNILNGRVSYHYTNCRGEAVAPQSVPCYPYPIQHRICQGGVGDIEGRPILDVADCNIVIAGYSKTLVTREGENKFDCTIGNITYHIEFSLSKPT